MKRFAMLALTALLAGCADSATDTASTTEATAEASTETAAVSTPATDVESGAVMASFDSGDTANLAIPEMHCPFMCFPKAKETLEEIDGVASVELVEQEEEGVIDDRRVVVTFDGSVSADTALAALEAVEFPDSSFETSVVSEN